MVQDGPPAGYDYSDVQEQELHPKPVVKLVQHPGVRMVFDLDE